MRIGIGQGIEPVRKEGGKESGSKSWDELVQIYWDWFDKCAARDGEEAKGTRRTLDEEEEGQLGAEIHNQVTVT